MKYEILNEWTITEIEEDNSYQDNLSTQAYTTYENKLYLPELMLILPITIKVSNGKLYGVRYLYKISIGNYMSSSSSNSHSSEFTQFDFIMNLIYNFCKHYEDEYIFLIDLKYFESQVIDFYNNTYLPQQEDIIWLPT